MRPRDWSTGHESRVAKFLISARLDNTLQLDLHILITTSRLALAQGRECSV